MVQLKRKVTLKEKHDVDNTEAIPSESKTRNESSSVSEKKSKTSLFQQLKTYCLVIIQQLKTYCLVIKRTMWKEKNWLFLLCGGLLVGTCIYLITRNSKGNEPLASNEVNKETPIHINEEEVSTVSEPVTDENSASVVEDKDIMKNDVVSIVENKEEYSNPVNSIVDNKACSSNLAEETNIKESDERNESLPMSEIERTAKDVIRGNYGNGRIRKEKLGDQYSVVQSKVNEMYRNRLK